jgi:hypothetical protein
MRNQAFGLVLANIGAGLKVCVFIDLSCETLSREIIIFYSDHNTELLFFHGPVLFILTTNIVFFALTVFKLFKMTRHTTAVLKRGDSMARSGTNVEKENTERLF